MSDITAPAQDRRDDGPLFSLLVAAYQAESTIGETLDSVLAQDFPDWEAIVVDDGSTDRTLAVARSYDDPRIHVMSQGNEGAGRARNAAAAQASGRWLLPLDADDLLLPGALSRQAEFVRANPGYDIYSLGVVVQSPDGDRFPWPVSARHDHVEEFDLAQLIEGNLLTAMTVISAERFRELGGFRNVRLEDYDLWLRALAAGCRHLHNPELLAVYRQSTSSKNADLSARWLGTSEVLADLASDERVPSAQRHAARRQARYWRAVDARRRLEAALRSGEGRGARLAYIGPARPAYTSAAKWLAALPVMLISPAMFGRFVRPAEDEAANVG